MPNRIANNSFLLLDSSLLEEEAMMISMDHQDEGNWCSNLDLEHDHDLLGEQEDDEEEDEEDGDYSDEEEDEEEGEEEDILKPSTSSTSLIHTRDIIIHIQHPMKKRLRKRKRKHYPVKKKLIFAPRVLKSDIRRQYAHMMINAINTGDFDHYYNFYKIFSIPSYIATAAIPPPSSLNGTSSSSSVPGNMVVNGLDQICCCAASVFTMIPDLIMRGENIQLHTRGGTSQCVIEFDFSLTGTLLLPTWFDGIVENVLGAVDMMKVQLATSAGDDDQEVDLPKAFANMVESKSKDLLLPHHNVLQQTKMHVQGKMKIFVNEERQIYLSTMDATMA